MPDLTPEAIAELVKQLRDIHEWLKSLHKLHPSPTHMEINLVRCGVNEAANALEALSRRASSPAPESDAVMVPRGFLSCVEGVLAEVTKCWLPTESNFDDDVAICLGQCKAALSAPQPAQIDDAVLREARARLQLELDNWGPLKQDGCDDVLSFAIAAIDAALSAPQPTAASDDND